MGDVIDYFDCGLIGVVGIVFFDLGYVIVVMVCFGLFDG